MNENLKGSNDSLIKYEHPQIVARNPSKTGPKNPSLKTVSPPSDASLEDDPIPKAKLQNRDFYRGNFQSPDDVLDAILPPKEWNENNQLWVQKVSRTPATRLDVLNLQEQLDVKLEQRQARETGICPIRRELYSQCFDEIIRQVTINCAERGLVLLRIRDEMRMTLSAYQILFESSIAFGIRKSLLSEQGKSEMEEKIELLEEEKLKLNRELNEWKIKCDMLDKHNTEQRQLDEKRHQEEIQNLKRTNQQLKAQLEGIINPKAVADMGKAVKA